MKFLVSMFFIFSSSVYADNIHIQTCDLRKNDELFKKISTDELTKKAHLYVKRIERCNAATAFLEMYYRGVGDSSKPAVFKSLFNALYEGDFLNSYTAMLMGLQNEMKFMNVEEISADHSRLYLKYIEESGKVPLSQFTVPAKKLTLQDEAEINFRFFIQNYPKNPLVKKLKEKVFYIHEQKIKTAIDYIKFYEKDGLTEEVLTKEVKSLAKILAKTQGSKSYPEGLAYLVSLIPRTTFSSKDKANIQNGALAILKKRSDGEKYLSKIQKQLGITAQSKSSNLDIYAIINPEAKKVLELNQHGSLDNFLVQKGNDSMVFLPLNEEHQFSATQVLVGLGVVGVLIAFDEPINNFIQKNKDAGILEEVANFGNHFGEVSGVAPVVLGTLAIGLVFNNDSAKNAAISSIGAIILAELVVETLKSATHRSRPEDGKGAFDWKGMGLGSGNTSFASGHSAAAWSVATVFAEEFGDKHKWAPAVAYSLAAVTSYARVHKNKHWASDVVMGAMIGYVAGKVFHKLYRKMLQSSINNVRFSPITGSDNGFMVTIDEKTYADLQKWPLDSFYNYQKAVLKSLDKNSEGLNALYEEVYLN
jgi:membrane-associated phospholipid phosphatase